MPGKLRFRDVVTKSIESVNSDEIDRLGITTQGYTIIHLTNGNCYIAVEPDFDCLQELFKQCRKEKKPDVTFTFSITIPAGEMRTFSVGMMPEGVRICEFTTTNDSEIRLAEEETK